MNKTLESEYTDFVQGRRKDPNDISIQNAPMKDILHMTLGVAGEAGELVDAVKKAVIYDQPLDVAHTMEELGDLEFYLQGLRSVLGVTRDTILRQNMAKLRKRYPDGYSNADAKARADKQTGKL